MTASNNTRNIERGQSRQSRQSSLLYGIGYNSKREHKSKGKVYSCWYSMFVRCYDEKIHQKYPTYIGCSVDSAWDDFQDFADWFVERNLYGKRYELDKDILIPNNKIYSPKTCCLVPHAINSLITESSSTRGDLPIGVSLFKRDGRYISSLSVNGTSKTLGFFDCPNEAHQAYVAAKERHVKDKALEYRDRIAPNVFRALMKWKVNA